MILFALIMLFVALTLLDISYGIYRGVRFDLSDARETPRVSHPLTWTQTTTTTTDCCDDDVIIHSFRGSRFAGLRHSPWRHRHRRLS